MASGQIKKLYILYILEILKRYSDYDHRLLQKDIIRYMKRDYSVDIERKSVARNIGDLCDLGFDIEQESGYYLASRQFEDSELRLLIDSVMASKYIPKSQAKDLIKKLTEQSSIYFAKQVKHISNVERMEHTPSQLFYSVDVFSHAIDEQKKVKFFYNRYDENKKLVKTSKEKHIVNPYQIVIANGRYYLIGNVDKYDNATHFRIERISEPEIIDEKVKPVNEIIEFKNGLDLPKHMAEHIYMFSGKSELVRLRVSKSAINDCIDWLGKDIIIKKESEDSYIVDLTANPQAMKYWAIQFGQHVEIIFPKSLREETAKAVENIWNKYRGDIEK